MPSQRNDECSNEENSEPFLNFIVGIVILYFAAVVIATIMAATYGV